MLQSGNSLTAVAAGKFVKSGFFTNHRETILRALAPLEVVAKVKEGASTLSKTGDLGQFNQKQGPWVWKDTYIFAHDCDKKVNAAHPMRPEQIGQDLTSVKDTKGKSLYPDPHAFCCS